MTQMRHSTISSQNTQQSNQQPIVSKNFTSVNSNDNFNIPIKSMNNYNNDSADSSHQNQFSQNLQNVQIQQKIQPTSQQLIQSPQQKQFLPQCFLNDCKKLMHHVDVDGISFDVFDFNLLMENKSFVCTFIFFPLLFNYSFFLV